MKNMKKDRHCINCLSTDQPTRRTLCLGSRNKENRGIKSDNFRGLKGTEHSYQKHFIDSCIYSFTSEEISDAFPRSKLARLYILKQQREATH